MYKQRSSIIPFLTILFWLGSSASSAAPSEHNATESTEQLELYALAGVQVTLSGVQTTTSWNSRLPEREPFALPVLYMHRQRQPTVTIERTLIIVLSGVAGGTEVEGEIVSLHVNPSTGMQHRESRRFRLPERPCSASEPCTLYWALEAGTLSDLYRLTLRDGDGELLWENPNADRPDLVVLDTWETGIEHYAVRVTYAVLFPFARGERDHAHRLAPDAVHDFIEYQLVPIILETWHTQFGTWGLGPIHPAWDADKVVDVYVTSPPFALFDGTGTYTVSTYTDGSPYPERGIWLLPNHNVLQGYDSLENGFRVVLSHEFFHLVQWNVRLSTGCFAHKGLKVFIESQATFAVSVQYPELELSRDHLVTSLSLYNTSARRFLERSLKTSYTALEADEVARYDVALYWRFLYEHFGGMHVIRAALEEMACRPIADVPAALDEIMDAALARVDGAQGTVWQAFGPVLRPRPQGELFERSLAAFAQANYALRLEDGRCTAGDLSTCEGRYYDPHRVYSAPMREAGLYYRGSTLAYHGSIPASYGSDLIEIALEPGLRGTDLAITFRSEGARFSVQAWKLYTDGSGMRNPTRGETGVRSFTPHPETLSGDCSVECRYDIPRLDPERVDRLALIVVRLDPHERVDPAGTYHLTVGAAQ